MNTLQTRRLLMWAAAALVMVSLLISLNDWWHGSLVFAGPKLADQFGLLVLLAAFLLTPMSTAVRNGLIAVALVLIVPSTLLILWRAL